MPRYLNAEQLREELIPGLSVKGIYRMAREKDMPHIRIDDRVLFDPHKVQLWLDSNSSENSQRVTEEPGS